MSFMASMFGTEKPVIGMLHLQPLPGDPLYIRAAAFRA